VSAFLAPKLKALETAVLAQQPEEIRSAIDALAADVGDLLWALEGNEESTPSSGGRPRNAPELQLLLSLQQAPRVAPAA
jgi:hypothetical protein